MAQPARVWDRPAVTVPVLVVLSLIGGRLPSFSAAATGYVLTIAAVLTWLALSGRVSDRRSSDPRVSDPRVSDRRSSGSRVSRRLGPGVGWWLAPLTLLAVVEGWALALGPRAGYPTLSLLADPLLAHPVARSVGYGGWLWAFWALVRR